MYIKTLRQDKRISQEQLAEKSGLSLRTIQRVESGHRVSFASLRSLANTFEIDVDTLERELYAMKTTDEFTELPLWVRLVFSKGMGSKNRHSNRIFEVRLVTVGVISFALCFSPFFDGKQLDHGHLTIDDQLLYVGLIMFSGAYAIATTIRLGDKYSVWSHLKSG